MQGGVWGQGVKVNEITLMKKMKKRTITDIVQEERSWRLTLHLNYFQIECKSKKFHGSSPSDKCKKKNCAYKSYSYI